MAPYIFFLFALGIALGDKLDEATCGESCVYQHEQNESAVLRMELLQAQLQKGRGDRTKKDSNRSGEVQAFAPRPVLGVSKDKNKLIGTIRLRNARWTDQYLYVSRFSGDLYVSASANDQDFISLYSLPGPGNDYLLYSAKWPTYVISAIGLEIVSRKWIKAVTFLRRWWDWAVNGVSEDKLTRTSKLLACTIGIENLASSSIDELSLRFANPPEFEGASSNMQFVMIEPTRFPSRFLYIGRYSFRVGLSHDDPGVGGYWVVESEDAVRLELPSYQGPRCNFDCGTYASFSAWTGGSVSRM